MRISVRYAGILAAGIAAAFIAYHLLAEAGDAKPAKSAAALEKEKALQNPYPNDLGPEKIDSEIKDYPADKKEGYKLLLMRCTQCHASSRPLNSRFVEPAEGLGMAPEERTKKQEATIASWKKPNPELFKEPFVWQVEAGIWSRYVKRMLNKPGCGKAVGGQMTNEEAKKIYEFLVYDGGRRKLGESAAKWKAHRQKLLTDFKQKHPARYKQLEKEKAL